MPPGPTDNEQKTFRGKPLRIPAATWNKVIDTVKDYTRQKGREGPAGEDTDTLLPADTILVQNTLSTDLTTSFQVLGIGDPVLTADADPVNLSERLALTGTYPAAGQPFAVLQEPCAQTEFARAAVGGYTVCYVKMNDPAHEWADALGTDSTQLTSQADPGPARIIWHGAGGTPPAGAELAVVHINGAGTASGSAAGFFARLTSSSSGKWKWVALTLDASGTEIDDGTETLSYNATPLKIDGTNLCNPVAGLRVWMIPSKQSGRYEFLPTGYAASGLPGLLSKDAQTITGLKSFETGAQVNPGNATVGMYPSDVVGNYRILPTGHVAAPAAYTPGALTDLDYIGFTGGLPSAGPVWGSFIHQGSSGAPNALWCFATEGADDSGQLILVGKYAVYWPTDGKVYIGQSGTLYGGATFKNGCVTDLGLAAPAGASLQGYSGGAAWITVGTGLDLTGTTLSCTVVGMPTGSDGDLLVNVLGAWNVFSPGAAAGWYYWDGSAWGLVTTGVSGTFTTADTPAKTVTVTNGLITSIM